MIRVWVTRDEPPRGPLAAALREAGLEPVHEPAIERARCSDGRDELAQLTSNDWLVLTSAFTVECLALDAMNAPDTLDADRPPHVVVVGEATAKAARDRGLRVGDEMPAGSAKELFRRLRERITRGTVCFPRSSLATEPEAWADVIVISPVVYETVPRDFDRSVIERVDLAAVASPSAVRAIGRIDLPLASIGPTTTQAIRDLGMEPSVEAERASFSALARAISEMRR